MYRNLFMKVLDPNEKYSDIYNRYAHVAISDYKEGEELIVLTAMDAIQINLDPCDSRLKDLNVNFVIAKSEFDKSCLELLRHFKENSIYIYQLN